MKKYPKIIANGKKLRKKNVLRAIIGNWDYKFDSITGTITFKKTLNGKIIIQE